MIHYISFNEDTGLWELRQAGNPHDHPIGSFPSKSAALWALDAAQDGDFERVGFLSIAPLPPDWRYSDEPDAAETARRGFQIIQV